MPIVFVPAVLIVVVTLSIALAGRLQERAAQDRFSFDDAAAIEMAVR